MDLVQDTSSFFYNTLPNPTIELRRIEIFKIGFRNKTIDFVEILEMTQMAGGWGSSCLHHNDALRTKIDN